MPWSEILFGSFLVGLLLAVSASFGIRQLGQLRRLRQSSLPQDELGYERAKAYRRLVGSGITLIMAGLLAVVLGVFGPSVQRLAEEREMLDASTAPEFTADQRLLLKRWGWSLVAMLLLLLAALALAGYDLWATRRHGWRQFRKIQAERRAMIQRQTTLLRQEHQERG